MTIRLFLITANNNYSKALEDFLPMVGKTSGHEIVLAGVASETELAKNQISAELPDLILADLGHPDGAIDGLAIARWTRSQRDSQSNFPPQVVLCSLYEDDIFHEASQKAGAAAFLVKNRLDGELPLILSQLFPLNSQAC